MFEVFRIGKRVEDVIEAVVKPIIENSGFEYVGTEIKKTGESKELIIYADKPGGIGLDDCEKISKLVEPAIDECDPIEDSYFLCVSSPGLDRALKSPRDFERSIGKKLDVKLYKTMDGHKEFTGILKAFNENGFEIEADGVKSFLYKDAAVVKMHVDI